MLGLKILRLIAEPFTEMGALKKVVLGWGEGQVGKMVNLGFRILSCGNLEKPESCRE